MSDIQVITQALARAARRRRRQLALAGLAQGLLAGSLLFLVALAAFKLTPVPPWLLPAAAITASLLTLGGLVRGGWRPPTLLETARWIDDRRQLRERLSTALELQSSPSQPPGEWQGLLLRDAASHARDLRIAELAPFRIPPAARPVAFILLLLTVLAFVPEFRTERQRQRAQESARIQETGRELAAVVRRELAQRPPALPPTEKSLQETAALGDKLVQDAAGRVEALREIARAIDQVAAQQRALQQNPALPKLAQAARESGGGTGPMATNALQRRLEQLQKELGAAAAQPGQLDALDKALDQARQQAASLPPPGTAAHEAAKAQMAQSLADLAKQAAAAGASLQDLESAMQALADGQVDRVLRDLQSTAQDLEKLQQMAKAMQQLQQQAAQLGRNLAEQLQKGQAQAAAQTLQQMMDQLRQGQLTQEQLEQIRRELAQSLEPAKDYGKIGDLLEQAAAQCQQGNRSGATESLAEARAELQKLMEQMADAQSLSRTLDALAQAEQAIRSGKSWSDLASGRPCSACGGQGCAECQGRGRGSGQGGGRQPGGVGTWAEEYGWTYFNESAGSPVDNSGIQRPDLAPRDPSDRPATLNPNLTPDKVKGRLAPGNPMPGITLKGVSIPGTSNVRFEEAAAAAQQEAQNALNQDQVPRAYQKAVRDYFDDLKK